MLVNNFKAIFTIATLALELITVWAEYEILKTNKGLLRSLEPISKQRIVN